MKEAGMAILISEKLLFRWKNIARNKEHYFKMIKVVSLSSGHNNPKWSYS